MTTEEQLPASLDAERYVLGSIMLDDTLFSVVADGLRAEDFGIEKHGRIFLRMGELHERGENIDRLTVAEELIKHNQLESCDGVGYLVSLDDGLPAIQNLDSYVRLVQHKAVLRRVIHSAEAIKKRAISGDDPLRIQENVAELLAGLEPREPGQRPVWASELVAQSNINHLLSPTRDAEGNIPLPWSSLDEKLCGLQRGQLILVAGHTGTGKTSFALQAAMHAAERTGVVYFSLEMEPCRLFRRMVVQRAKVDHDDLRHGALSAVERRYVHEAATWIESIRIAYDERAKTVHGIISAIRRANRKHPVGLVVVDYLQRLRSVSRYSSRAQEVAEQSRALKQEAMDLGIPFLVLSQFNRESAKADRDPTLHDLKESGDIENDADTILLLLPDRKQPQDELARRVNVRIDKQREGVVGHDTPMLFHSQYQRFEECEPWDKA